MEDRCFETIDDCLRAIDEALEDCKPVKKTNWLHVGDCIVCAIGGLAIGLLVRYMFTGH